MCKNVVKKLLLVIIYVPNQYKTQEICNKVILNKDVISISWILQDNIFRIITTVFILTMSLFCKIIKQN